MLSVMNSSNLPNFNTDSAFEFRDSDDSEKDGKLETRVSNVRSRGNKMEKLTMREDELAKHSYGKMEGKGLDFGSAYARVDEGAAARMSEAFGSEAEKALSYGFEPGDMVWGKVKSHPWWPGHVFNEALANSSVRRTKRAGHVLVAFFGDSSYGWFDPAELIPFDPHYAEKSRQSNSKTFTKASDEAIDEASRRCALGLTCRCRNPFNFRPTHVRSYFAVDVPGYEAGAVYSLVQIKKARERFQSMDALEFVQQLALNPLSFDKRDMESIKNKATILAYRKATFEEFDETYAQAFGMQPVRPSRAEMDQIAKMSNQAPLSGPMVIAEALNEKKSTSKLSKVKEQLKKDQYLLKRRDEASEPGLNHATKVYEGAAVSAANEGVTAMTPEDYVFQKRSPVSRTDVPVEQDGTGTITVGDNLGRRVHGDGDDSIDRKPVAADIKLVESHVGLPAVASPSVESVAHISTSASQIAFEDGRLPLDSSRRMASSGDVGSKSVGWESSSEKSGLPRIVHKSSKDLLPETTVDMKSEDLKSNVFEYFDSHNQGSPMAVDGHDQVLGGSHVKDVSESVATPQLLISTESHGMVPQASVDGLVPKKKVLKRPAGDLNSEKKKRKKKEPQFEASTEFSNKRLKASKEEGILKKSAGKSIGIGLPASEKSQLDLQQRNNGSGSMLMSSDSALTLEKVDLGDMEVELPEVVSDMLALALDPFYGAERNSAAVVRQVLLRFRSLVYQKSLVSAPASEAEGLESYVSKPSANTVLAETPDEDVRVMTPKHPKYLPRPNDPTKAGRKRSLSDRQEEMSAKRIKKINELKSMTAERKAGSQKIADVQREKKDANIASAPAKLIKLESVKKQESPARAVEPGMLVMRFPEKISLPSAAELKARFGRFGPLDQGALRIFWKSSQCRVVFVNKAHAREAYNYAIRNNGLFGGHGKVNYQLKDVGGQAPAEAESTRWQVNGASDEVAQFRPMVGGDSVLGPRPGTPVQQRSRQPNAQLKSCLKRPSGDEVGSTTVNNVSREVPRVKFMLGGEESSRGGEQLMVGGSGSSKDPNNNNGTSASTSGDGGASSVLAMDVNSKNLQKVISQTLPLNPPAAPPILPFPPRVQDMHVVHESYPVVGHGHQINVEPKVEPVNFNNYYYNTSGASTAAASHTSSSNNKKIDISHQMLSLLMRCNDIVTNVKGTLGYVPYHPL